MYESLILVMLCNEHAHNTELIVSKTYLQATILVNGIMHRISLIYLENGKSMLCVCIQFCSGGAFDGISLDRIRAIFFQVSIVYTCLN